MQKLTRAQIIKHNLDHIRFGVAYQDYYRQMGIAYKPHKLLNILTYPVATRISDPNRCTCVPW